MAAIWLVGFLTMQHDKPAGERLSGGPQTGTMYPVGQWVNTSSLSLQKSSGVSVSNIGTLQTTPGIQWSEDIQKRISQRMNLWEDGLYGTLVDSTAIGTKCI
eukprot:1099883-Ditylum_brightwellii.AAC.1